MEILVTRLLQFGPNHDPMIGGWMGWGGLLWLVVVALLLAAVVFAVVRLVVVPVVESTDPFGERPTADPARAALRERFARGEIDEAEFERRLAVLATDESG